MTSNVQVNISRDVKRAGKSVTWFITNTAFPLFKSFLFNFFNSMIMHTHKNINIYRSMVLNYTSLNTCLHQFNTFVRFYAQYEQIAFIEYSTFNIMTSRIILSSAITYRLKSVNPKFHLRTDCKCSDRALRLYISDIGLGRSVIIIHETVCKQWFPRTLVEVTVPP